MLTTYIIGSLALIVKPGPDLTCTIATALSDGKARAATLMLGLVAGCWLWILLLTAGVASFFTAHPATMSAIQIAGAAYIAYLAYGAFADAIRSFRAASPDALRPASGRGFRLFLRGFTMSLSKNRGLVPGWYLGRDSPLKAQKEPLLIHWESITAP